ncbi:MAG: XrtA-associated tyrosine autokinase [bacterium]
MSTIEKAVKKLSGHGQNADEAESYALPEVSEVDSFESFAEATHREQGEYLGDEIEDDFEEKPRGARPRIDIPWARLEDAGMVLLSAPRSAIAEEYRIIKRPLLMNIQGKSASRLENPNLIMVTSCFQGEGKTFSALNLALSMALEKDKTVLFVDGDVSKASAGALLGVPGDTPGLIDLLEHDDIDVEDVLLRTSEPNLRMISAGQIHERSTELLASQQMLSLAKELSERYPNRVVIFDSPPLLMTTEARVLCNAMGQVVFVVAAEQTPASAIKEALEHISPDKAVGMVLNKAKRNLWNAHGYGYGYGYGYHYGGRSVASEGATADTKPGDQRDDS